MATKPGATSQNSPQTEAAAPPALPSEGSFQTPGEQPNSVDNSPQDAPRDDDGFIDQPVAVTHVQGPFLVGRSDIGTQRKISEADFASVGIEQSTLIFEWKKGYKIPLKDINPAAVQFLVDTEYGFSVSDE